MFYESNKTQNFNLFNTEKELSANLLCSFKKSCAQQLIVNYDSSKKLRHKAPLDVVISAGC